MPMKTTAINLAYYYVSLVVRAQYILYSVACSGIYHRNMVTLFTHLIMTLKFMLNYNIAVPTFLTTDVCQCKNNQ